MNVQRDFGGFDPSFIGISARFETFSAWQIFDRFSKDPNLPDVLSLPLEERFEALAICSVRVHEARHFHDFFLTSYSSHVFRLRIQALVNLLEILPYLSDSGANCLPVPISRWCKLSDSRRSEELSWLGQRSDGRPWLSVDLPLIESEWPASKLATRLAESQLDAVEGNIRAILNAHERIAELSVNPGTVGNGRSLQPWQIFELSAVLVQIQEVFSTFGVKEAEFLSNRLANIEGPYGSVIRLMHRLFDQAGEPIDTHLASAIASWCLMGSYGHDRWNACPSERFVRLWSHFSKCGLPKQRDDVMKMFDEWSHSLKVSTVAEGVEDARNSFSGIKDSLERLFRDSDTFVATTHGSLLMRFLNGVARSSDHMARMFCQDPTRYVNPYSYVTKADHLVNPIMRTVCEGGGLSLSIEQSEFEKRGGIIEWASKERSLVYSMIQPAALSEHSFLRPADASEISTLITLTKFLFAETGRADEAMQRVGRAFFQESDVSPVELLC